MNYSQTYKKEDIRINSCSTTIIHQFFNSFTLLKKLNVKLNGVYNKNIQERERKDPPL